MKKILVVLGIVLGAAVATSAVRADKSNLTALNDNGCVGCVHECLGTAKECRREARKCSTDCMTAFREVLVGCMTQPPGTFKRDCLQGASGDFSACKKECANTVVADCTDVEQDCLKDCVQVPGDNSTIAPCADLCITTP